MNKFKVGDEVWYFCDNTDAPGVGLVVPGLKLFNSVITDISSKGVYMWVINQLGEEIVKISSCFSSKLEAISAMTNHLTELER